MKWIHLLQIFKTIFSYSLSYFGLSRMKNISVAWWFLIFIDDHYISFSLSMSWFLLNLSVKFKFLGQAMYETISIQPLVLISHPMAWSTLMRLLEEKLTYSWASSFFMFSHNVPNHFLGEVILTTTFLMNWLPSCVFTLKSPKYIRQIHPKFQDLSSTLLLRVFGCYALVH